MCTWSSTGPVGAGRVDSVADWGTVEVVTVEVVDEGRARGAGLLGTAGMDLAVAAMG